MSTRTMADPGLRGHTATGPGGAAGPTPGTPGSWGPPSKGKAAGGDPPPRRGNAQRIYPGVGPFAGVGDPEPDQDLDRGPGARQEDGGGIRSPSPFKRVGFSLFVFFSVL